MSQMSVHIQTLHDSERLHANCETHSSELPYLIHWVGANFLHEYIQMNLSFSTILYKVDLLFENGEWVLQSIHNWVTYGNCLFLSPSFLPSPKTQETITIFRCHYEGLKCMSGSVTYNHPIRFKIQKTSTDPMDKRKSRGWLFSESWTAG